MRHSRLGLISVPILLIGACSDISQANSAEPDRGDPENTLKTLGLRKSGWVYVLESESAFHSKVNDARVLYQTWMKASARFYQQEQEAQAILDLTAQSNLLNQNLAELHRQRASGVAYGGRRAGQFRRMQNQLLNSQANELQANLNQIHQRLNQLKKNAPKPKEKKEVEEEASRTRTAAHDPVVELGTLADSIHEKYHELHQSKELEAALASLSRSQDTKFKLGPSREHSADLKILQKLKHELGITRPDRSRSSRAGARSTSKAKPQA